MADGIRVTVRGVREVQRALTKLVIDAREELHDGQTKLARELAAKIRAAGAASSRQSARAARTVRVVPSGVQAGPHPLLFGSEFGSNARWGWYSARRYARDPDRQFRPRRGGSYWFFRTAEANSGAVDREAAAIGVRVIGKWGA